MKKWFIILAALVIFISLASLSPLLLKHNNAIKERVTLQLSSLLGEKAQITELNWRWLPIPALQIKNLTSNSEAYSIKIPQILLYPNWRSVFNRKFSLGKVTCISPKVVIKVLNRSKKIPWPSYLPNVKFDIKDGTLSLPATNLPGGIILKPQQLNGLQLQITSLGRRLKVEIQTKANFSDDLNLLARIDLSKQYYHMDLDGQAINLARLFTQVGNVEKTLPTDFPVKLHAEGIGANNWQIGINKLNAPCPIYLAGNLYNIKRLANLKITKHDTDYFINLNNLELSAPALSLSGTISRRHLSGEIKPQWAIDLKGHDIDLKAVREIILKKFTNNHIAQEVCSIVLGGRAKSARYTFNGPISDFKHIHKMKIWVDVDHAPILIPHIGLNLDWASGPISIINGDLAGKGLNAQINKSRGQNGKLFLSLNQEDKSFNLDIDLDADLQDLKQVLQEIVPSQPFQDELCRFKDVKGRAKGNLQLGDMLNELTTHVTVQKMDGQGRYNRLPWNFTIKGGNLKIAPQQVNWDDIQGFLGPHIIKQSQGNVSWLPGQEAILDIEELDADLNLSALWETGSLLLQDKRKSLKQYFTNELNNISGQAELRKCKVSGPASHPGLWDFDSQVRIHNLIFSSPRLPGILQSDDAQANLSTKKASLIGIFRIADQPIFINGQYGHHNLKKWHGSSTFNGVITKKFGQWLKDQALIPTKFFPRLPCTLSNFTITNNNPSWTDTRIKGVIIADPKEQNRPELHLDLIRTPNVSLNNLTIHDGSKKGQLTYMRNVPLAKTVFTWHGILQASALNKLLQQRIVDSGEISGSFNMLSSHQKGISASFSGYLEARDLTMHPSSDNLHTQPTIFKDITLSGLNDTITISKVDIRLGPDILHGQGSIKPQKDNYELRLNMTSNELNWHNLQQSIHTIKDKLQTDTTPISPKLPQTHKLSPKGLSGIINFDLKNFVYSKTPDITDQERSKNTIYTWSPLVGSLTFQGYKDTKVKIQSGLICGMNMSGLWDIGGPPQNSSFNILQDKNVFLFEETLPCLGVNQSLIEGPFSLNAHFTGLPGNWRNGHLNLQSPHGLIRKMDILSKIFSVINFTDLLTWTDQSSSGHKGLEYNKMEIKTSIKDNVMNVDKIVLKGKGVNLTGRGTIAMHNQLADLTFFIAPLKMIDSILTNIPLLGKALGGKKESIFTFPVGVAGPLKNPEVTALPPSAIGRAAVEFIMDTLTLPLRIFAPLLPSPDQEPPRQSQ